MAVSMVVCKIVDTQTRDFYLPVIAYVHMPIINTRAEVSSDASVLNFGLSFHIHPSFVHASSKGSGESVDLRRLAKAFVTRQCNSANILCTCSR